MQLQMYDSDNYYSYQDAKESGAIYTINGVSDDSTDFRSGTLADLLEAISVAMDCVGCKGRITYALVENDKIINFC